MGARICLGRPSYYPPSHTLGESEMKNAPADRAAESAGGASRRDFLKTSSVLAAGGALAGSLSIARSAHAGSDETIKIALIGCGGRGTEACSQALSTTNGPIKLVAMADAFQDRLEGSLQALEHRSQGSRRRAEGSPVHRL